MTGTALQYISLNKKNDSLTAVIDTLKNKQELLEIKIQLQEELITSQKSSVAIQKKIQSQLENIRNSYFQRQ